MELNGIICMYKPKGFTSFDVIAKMRGILKMKRLGHAGTLDPMAEGVLPVFAGRATMACDMLPDHDKVYRGGFKLGIDTDTQDITGKVLSEKEVHISEAEILSVLDSFRGDIMQIPPMYSAVSVNGQRLYDLARKNITVEREPRPITVYSLELVSYDEAAGEGVLEISCSKGTYIRTIISDIGNALGTGAAMTSLVRTKACGFSLDECTDFAALQKEADGDGNFARFAMPIEKVFSYLPEIRLMPFEERLYRNGIKLDTKRIGSNAAAGRVRVYGAEGFIGTADIEPVTGIIKVGKTFVLSVNEQRYDGKYSVALGLFDGVHKGHRAVIAAAVKKAEENGLKTAVFTFDTATVSSKDISGSCIISEAEKERRLKECGAEFVYSPNFADIKDMSAEEFVRDIAVKRMRAAELVCGEDFRFGKGAVCGVDELKEICGQYGCGLTIVPVVPDENGEKISSGRIRKLIAEGNVGLASQLMCGDIVVDMPVISGNRLGRTIGIPTVNQHFPDEQQPPRFGVYASEIYIDGKKYHGISNIGVKPTVTDSGAVLCETNIFDFSGDIYGMNIRVVLLGFVRSEKKFSGLDELKAQINSDIENIKKSFEI